MIGYDQNRRRQSERNHQLRQERNGGSPGAWPRSRKVDVWMREWPTYQQKRQQYPDKRSDKLARYIENPVPRLNLAQAKEHERHCRIHMRARSLAPSGVDQCE